MDKKNTTQCFVTYSKLNRKDRLLFVHSGLNWIIVRAGRILSKRIDNIDIHNFDQQLFSEKDLNTLNLLVAEILQLIGKHTNQRWGLEALAQNSFFQKPGECETFPIHLEISKWKDMREQLIKKDPENKNRILDLPGKIYSKERFKEIPYANKTVFTSERLTDSEVQAIGVLYMVGLAWNSLKDSTKQLNQGTLQADVLTQLFSLVPRIFLLLDETDKIIARSNGGRKRYAEEHQIIAGVVEQYPDEPKTKKIAKVSAELAKANKKKLTKKTIRNNLSRIGQKNIPRN